MEWFGSHRIYLQATVEVFIIFIFVYAFLRIMQGTRGAGILRGLGIMVGLLAGVTILVTRVVPLENISWVMSTFAPVIIIPMFILFQPEVRRALIRLGQNPLYRMFFKPHSRFTDELVRATFSLSRDKVGGLLAIEREVGLRGYVEGGVRLDAEVTADLIKTIFWPGTPLHDGAVVIRQQRLAAAGCLFPLTDNPQFSTELGTRHRAAIGITEESDAAAIVISEQTGQVSLAVGGTIQRDVSERDLRRALE
jgi:diadenylate cyclase